MNPQPSVSVLGCGYWGSNLVRNMHALRCLRSVHDPDPETAARVADEYRIPAVTLEEVMGDDEVTAVVIAAPAALHHDLARTALESGKHVFVEKPLALDVDDAAALCELAKRRERVLMVGHLLRYHPAYLKVQQLVVDGALGELQYVYSNRLNLGRFRTEENILWSFAPHDISMVLDLVGSEPSRIRAVGSVHLDHSLVDVTITHLDFPNSVAAHIFVSWLHPFKEQKLVVVGANAMAVFDDLQPWDRKVAIYPHRVEWPADVPTAVKGDPEWVAIEADEPLRRECLHFLECIETGATPTTDGDEGLRVLKVLAAAQRSLSAEEAT